ncbi:putative transcription factor MYB-HB-like family [Medicago truncatula]|uniref:Putative transcription factor MYB-HB-like family n=1 Tax=Medicago truncatula TaxID=3880 RepID=A0A396HY12_MEDTR|nr:putative transcription factor MYB-HB-like family [Medicago truncatula]
MKLILNSYSCIFGIESMEGRKSIQSSLLQIDLNESASAQDPSEHSMEQQQEKTGTNIDESGHAVAILNSNDNSVETLNSNENNLIQAESVPEESHAPRKGHWTEDEHKLFLKGLKKHGKGCWKDISKEFVVTKTPTQIASHAQKYFIHQNVKDIEKKEKKRKSIHDTTLNKNDTLVTVAVEQRDEIPSVELQSVIPPQGMQQTQTQQNEISPMLCLLPISSTIPSVQQQNELTPVVTAPMEQQHETPAILNNKDNENLQTQLVLLYPIGSTLPDMNKLEKMCNLLAKEL